MAKYILTLISMILPLFIIAQRDQAYLQNHFQEQDQQLWNQINTFSASGIWISKDEEFRADFLMKKPERIKIIEENKDQVYAFDGKIGWMKKKGAESAELLDEERSMMLSYLYSFGSPLFDNPNLKYMGEVSVERVFCYWWVKIEGDIRFEYFVDKQKGLLYKMIIEKKSTEGQNEFSISKTITQYRNFQGVMVPSVILIRSANHEWEIAFDEMVLGEGISSAIFEFPKN